MTDFNKGDRIRITDLSSGNSRTLWVAEDSETGELFTYHGLDPFAPNVPISELLAEDGLKVDLDLAFEDALPTVPGDYEDKIRQATKEEILSIDPAHKFDEDSDKPWVLGEDGSWTAPNGEHRTADHNWLLTVNGFEFFPWDERTTR